MSPCAAVCGPNNTGIRTIRILLLLLFIDDLYGLEHQSHAVARISVPSRFPPFMYCFDENLLYVSAGARDGLGCTVITIQTESRGNGKIYEPKSKSKRFATTVERTRFDNSPVPGRRYYPAYNIIQSSVDNRRFFFAFQRKSPINLTPTSVSRLGEDKNYST